MGRSLRVITAGAVGRAAGGIASMAEQVAGGRIGEEDSKGVQVDCLSQSTGAV